MEHEFTTVETSASPFPVEIDVGSAQIEFLEAWGVIVQVLGDCSSDDVMFPMTIADARNLVAALNAAIAKAEAKSAELVTC